MHTSRNTIICVALAMLVGCSESTGSPSLTFTGIGGPSLSLDAYSSVGFDVAVPGDGGLLVGPDAGEEDTSPTDTEEDIISDDVMPDVVSECDQDEDCLEVLGESACKLAICSEAGMCEWQAVSDGQPCEDADACTYSDACVEGACTGVPVECESDNPCVMLECKSDEGCVDSGKAEGTLCDDGDSCTAGDLCIESQCTGTPVCECEQDDECVDDGNVCNGTPVCENNVCVIDQGSVVLCEVGSACIDISCNPETGACEDKKLTGKACDAGSCLQQGACAAGACVGVAVVCDDGNVCTLDSCDVDSGLCKFVGQSGVACDDGEVCTLQDGCVDGLCKGGIADDCNDEKPCTVDACTPGVGCEYKDTACDDVDVCTEDVCKPDIGCVFSPVVCDDDNECTKDACEEGNGCVAVAIVCDDDNACTDDSCSPEVGCVFEAPGCDDGDACTVDTCDAVGGCAYEPLSCDDDDLCTNEKCDPVEGCMTAKVLCDDGLLCTTDSCVPAEGCVYEPVVCPELGECQVSNCNEQTGECVVVPIAVDASCDDGNGCTVGDECIAGQCIGSPLVCDDENECTKDACIGDTCVFEATDDAPCDAGNLCTIGLCAGGGCDILSACDDFDECTLDSCDDDGQCSYTPNPQCQDPECDGKTGGEVCDDGDPATAADMCVGGQCIGFSDVAHNTDPSFGNLSFDEVGYTQGVWTTTITTFGSNFDATALIDITVPETPTTYDGSSLYGPVFTSIHGRFAVTDGGDLFEYDGETWSDGGLLVDLLTESGLGEIQDVYAVEDADGPVFWVVGRDENGEYIRRCSSNGCKKQFVDWGGFGNQGPQPRAITGYKNCINGVCFDRLEMGVDQSVGNNYVSHLFGNKSGEVEVWTNTFNDPGASQDRTQDIAAYGDGRFLAVGNNGYMRYHDGSQWQYAIDNLPGNEASRTFTGVWIGADVVIVSAWRTSGFSRVLELWTTAREANPQSANSWTVHTLDSVYGDEAGLFDVWGLDNGSIRLVGSGRQTWNGFQQGIVFSRN